MRPIHNDDERRRDVCRGGTRRIFCGRRGAPAGGSVGVRYAGGRLTSISSARATQTRVSAVVAVRRVALGVQDSAQALNWLWRRPVPRANAERVGRTSVVTEKYLDGWAERA